MLDDVNIFDGEDEVLDIISMTDEDGNDVSFAVVDGIEIDGVNYLLVVEAENLEDEEAEALILKETSSDDEEMFYEVVEDEEEFNKVYILLQDADNEYDIKL